MQQLIRRTMSESEFASSSKTERASRRSDIAGAPKVQTSEDAEQRYMVWLTLRCREVEKRVLVTLNDRTDMTYPLLIGRNFLRDDFVVDVGMRSIH